RAQTLQRGVDRVAREFRSARERPKKRRGDYAEREARQNPRRRRRDMAEQFAGDRKIIERREDTARRRHQPPLRKTKTHRRFPRERERDRQDETDQKTPANP